MTILAIAGITHLSDLYPNVKYKTRLLAGLRDCEPAAVLYDLGTGSFYKSASGNTAGKILGLIRTCWGHGLVFTRLVLKRPDQVYVCYPGIFLVNLYSLLPARLRPTIHLDAFISLYDTAINDRRMYDDRSWRARLLYRLERRAFASADHVITDTRENALYYSDLYSLPREKFTDIPLSIPPFPVVPGDNVQRDFTCLFVGSLVPLQGIETILEAADQLRDVPAIRFRIIGDGQDATLVEAYMEKRPLPNLTWERGFFPTAHIAAEIGKASLCLGIFGQTEKANRVFPYKLYYYCRAGKPFITRKTPCAERLCSGFPDDAALVDAGGRESVADRIKKLYENPDLLHTLGQASENLFKQRFSDATIERQLHNLLGTTEPGA